MKRNATAYWNGSGKEGKGFLSTQSGVLNRSPYSFSSRFAEGTGTNPEELIAAAHAGCFAMKLSFVLGEAGFVPESLEVSSEVNLENGVISSSHLSLKARIPGISPAKFQEYADDAKQNCPISKSLNTAISLEVQLLGA